MRSTNRLVSSRSERLLTIASSFLLVVGLSAVADADRGTNEPNVTAGPEATDATAGGGDATTGGSTTTTGGAATPSPTGDAATAAPGDGGDAGDSTTGADATVGGDDGSGTTTTTGGTSGDTTGGGSTGSATTTGGTSGSSTGGTSGSTTGAKDPTAWPSSGLFTEAEDRIGLTPTSLKLCMHAAFLLGSVFDNHPEDERVYWDMINEDQGGIYGRKVSIAFKDDQYTASGARTAAAECESEKPFLMLGGVGFDQTPAVRAYAESARMPYIHTMAVKTGAEDLEYSFTASPTIEDVGRMIAQRSASMKDKKHGILWVNSENWKAGRDSYLAQMAKQGQEVVYDDSIGSNNDDLTSKIVAMKAAGVEVIYFHANALAMSKFFVQADQQSYYPKVLGEDGFNLVTDTSGDVMTKFPAAEVVWITPAYDPNDASLPWAGEKIQKMLKAYAKYNPSKAVNDVDWQFWLASKLIHQQLLDCGADCTRNEFTGMMTKGGYSSTVAPMCNYDFSKSNGHFGGQRVNLWQAQPNAAGNRSIWKQIETCKTGF